MDYANAITTPDSVNIGARAGDEAADVDTSGETTGDRTAVDSLFSAKRVAGVEENIRKKVLETATWFVAADSTRRYCQY